MQTALKHAYTVHTHIFISGAITDLKGGGYYDLNTLTFFDILPHSSTNLTPLHTIFNSVHFRQTLRSDIQS